MFGIPQEFALGFLKSWRGTFEGFELNWIQNEICRWASEPTAIGELRERMAAQYSKIAEMHPSNFYRIVQDLVDKGMINVVKEGRSKIIQISPLGAEELGKISRYVIELVLDRIKYEFWVDLIQKVTPHTGCLLEDRKVVVIGPEYRAVEAIVRACQSCPARGSDTLAGEVHEFIGQFIFLDYGADTSGKTENSTINQTEIDDWPFKDNFADVVIEFTAIGSFDDKDIISEAMRVLKPEGYLIIFELTEEASQVALVLLRELAMLLNITKENQFWQIKEDLMTREEFRKIVENIPATMLVEFIPDIINTKAILRKIP